MNLLGDSVLLRPLAAEHVPHLVEIGREPAVSRWWPGIDDGSLREKVERRSGATAFAIEYEDDVIGLVQYYEHDDPEYRHASIDVFITERRHGRGLGRDAVRTLARHLVEGRGHHRLTIDPALENERAVRCYESVGFRRVGVLRKYWLGPDGSWRDGLLLDLLAEEL